MTLNKISCCIVLTDQIKQHYFFESPRFLLDFCWNFVSKERFFLEFAWGQFIWLLMISCFLFCIFWIWNFWGYFRVLFFMGNIFCLDSCLGLDCLVLFCNLCFFSCDFRKVYVTCLANSSLCVCVCVCACVCVCVSIRESVYLSLILILGSKSTSSELSYFYPVLRF